MTILESSLNPTKCAKQRKMVAIKKANLYAANSNLGPPSKVCSWRLSGNLPACENLV